MSSQTVDTSSAVARPAHVPLVVLDGRGTGVDDVVRLAAGLARPVPGTDGMKRDRKSVV